jgi:hypothetical protein
MDTWDQESDVFNDMNVLYDEEEGVFRMWYCVGCYAGKHYHWLRRLAYATSSEGLHWNRPELGLVHGRVCAP